MVSIDAIFFDVDGTLVDSQKDIVKAISHTLKALGAPERPEELIVSYIGTGVKDLVRKSLGGRQGALVDKGVEIFGKYYMAHATDESKLYPHVRKTLEHFSAKRKFIVTNRYEQFADATLKGLGIREYFEDIFGGDDEACLKPSACVLDKAMAALRIDKNKTLIVGDMAIDINTGKNSGIKTCWVTYGLGKKEEALAALPDFIINDMIELTRIIK